MASNRRFALSLGSAIVAVLIAHAWRAVGAEPLELISLELKAPSACPSREDLVGRLRHDLEDSRQRDHRLAVSLDVQRGSAGWRASLSIRSSRRSDEREFSAVSCDAIFDATSLIVATVFDPELASAVRVVGAPTPAHSSSGSDAPSVPVAPRYVAALPSSTSSDAASGLQDSAILPRPLVEAGNGTQPQAQRGPVATSDGANTTAPYQTHNNPSSLAEPPPRTARMAVAAPPKPRDQARSHKAATAESSVIAREREGASRNRTSSGVIGIEVWADVGSLPSPTEAVRGLVGFVHGLIRAEARAGWWLPRAASTADVSSPGAGGSFSLFAADVRLCLNVLERSHLGVYPCAGMEVDRWAGEGNATLTKQMSTALWGTSVAGAALLVYEFAQHVALRGTFETVFPLSPPGFGFLESGSRVEVFRPNRIVIRVGGGLEFHFR